MIEIKTIGDLFRQVRTQRGWSATEVCRRAGISGSTYSLIEHNETTKPEIVTIYAIARALEIDLELANYYLGIVVPSMTDDDREMLGLWRSLTPERRQAIKILMRT